jgi:hypothetical protein
MNAPKSRLEICDDSAVTWKQPRSLELHVENGVPDVAVKITSSTKSFVMNAFVLVRVRAQLFSAPT